jgi:cytochrome d ubiquinol oxidase subunit II
MSTLWFAIVAVMLSAYVVLDGFDLGAGALYKLVARTDEDRAVVRETIGPVWDANEVWLLAAGGTLYFAFPQLYASSFSGFYLPLMMVLWMLIGRALGLELRGHLHNPLARELCDAVFQVSSLLLLVFFGAALGNVVRGLPLDAEGYFFLPLWTTFRPGPNPGVLDWYTVLCGVVALVAVGTHGAHYLAARTGGDLNARVQRLARLGTNLLPLVTAASLVGTLVVRPALLDNFRSHPFGLLLPLLVTASLVAMQIFARRGQSWRAFGSSVGYLVGMLGGAAFGLYPTLLPAIGDPGRSLTIHNSATSTYAMNVALLWWTPAFLVALALFTFLYRTFRGKVASGVSGSH